MSSASYVKTVDDLGCSKHVKMWNIGSSLAGQRDFPGSATCSVFHQFVRRFVADNIGDLASDFGVSVRVEDTDSQ